MLLAARNYVESTETSYPWGKISFILSCLALSSILIGHFVASYLSGSPLWQAKFQGWLEAETSQQ